MSPSFSDWDPQRSPTIEECFDALPPTMTGRPYGKTEDGRPLNLTKGGTMVPFIEFTLDRVASNTVAQLGSAASPAKREKVRSDSWHQALDTIIERSNEFIVDSAYHITADYLLDQRNDWSTEFDEHASRVCFDLVGRDPEFFLAAGDAGVPRTELVLARPLSLRQVYTLLPRLVRWTTDEEMYADLTGPTSATIRWSSNVAREAHSTEVWRAYTRTSCDYISAIIAALPREHSSLAPARFEDVACQLRGDEWCEWSYTWEDHARPGQKWTGLGLGASVGLSAWALSSLPGSSVATWFALLPAVVGLVASYWISFGVERAQREALLVQQRELAESEFSHSATAFADLQRANADLEDRYRQIERLQETLEERVEERTRQLSEARQAAEAASETKSAFLANVSHELRTPLTSILGFVRLVEKRVEERIVPALDLSDDRTEKALRRIQENLAVVAIEGRRLTALINDVLDLEKIAAGEMSWQHGDVDPSDLVHQAVSAVTALAEEKSLPIEIDLVEQLASVDGDRDRLVQVLINLLSNALKFTDNGTIAVTVLARPTEIEFRVRDDGIGIPESDQDAIFERFQQSGDTLTEKPRGTGLGLPICREIVEHHNGRIWVESAVGHGSVFAFTLPLAAS